MKPLLHPSADTFTVAGILHALSDPVRLELFTHIARGECAQTCTGLVEAAGKTVPKSTLSQHFKALREAGLIHSERRGVEMLNTSRCAEIDRKFPGLLAAILAAHKAQARRSRSRGR